MNGGYASELSDYILDHPQIKVWCHGHIHYAFDYMIGDTRIVCNPYGYHNSRNNEPTGFNADCKVTVTW